MGIILQNGLFFFLSVLLIAATVSDAEDVDAQNVNYKKLKDDLFKNYDKSIRPVIHHTNITNISIGIYPEYIIDLDEDKSLFSLEAILILFWVDERLSWNMSDYENLNKIQVAGDSIWQSDITVYNSHSSEIDPKKNTHAVVYWSGVVVHVSPAVLNTYCVTSIVNGGSYPKDMVTCKVVLGSWTQNGWQLDLKLISEKVNLRNFHNTNPRWELLTDLVTIQKEVKKYNCCEEPYQSVVTSFPMKRRPPPELYVAWAPCVLVMVLTICMFWIPSGSGKKITLGSVLFIVLSVFTVYIGVVTRSPQATIVAVSFLESTMYAVVSSLLLEVFVINIGRLASPHRPPSVLVRLLTGSLGKYICIWTPWQQTLPGHRIQLKEDVEHVNKDPTVRDEWLLISTALDRILCVVYIVVLATIHQI